VHVNVGKKSHFGPELSVLLVSCQNITIMTQNNASNAQLVSTLRDQFVSALSKIDLSNLLTDIRDLRIFYFQNSIFI
jgi:hypothetical protein